jgi:hypothetical protein
MVKDLRQTVVDLGKALAKLLNIDPKSWSLKWDFSNFITQMGEFSKMLSMIGDLLSAIKDGRWSDAASIGKQLLSQGNNNPDALPGVSDSANGAADWIKDKFGLTLAASDDFSVVKVTRLQTATTTLEISAR